MQVELLKSKIHRATITQVNLDYKGSLSLDESLMRAASLLENEKVQVVNLNNGSRFETYVLKEGIDTGIVCLNGAAARLGIPGDKVIIMSFAHFSSQEAQEHKPTIIKLDERNKISR